MDKKITRERKIIIDIMLGVCVCFCLCVCDELPYYVYVLGLFRETKINDWLNNGMNVYIF